MASQSVETVNMLSTWQKRIKFADQVTFRSDYPRLSHRPNVITKVLISGRGRLTRGNWRAGSSRRTQLDITCFEGVREPRNTVASRSWRRQGDRFLPQSLRRHCIPAKTLVLGHLCLFWNSDLQNYQKINLCWLKLLSLWSFVTTGI